MWKIAICDDDQKMLDHLRDLLIQEPYELKVDEFLSGSELEAKANMYDLIFLDIDMPGKNGIAVGQQIRSLNKQCSIVYVTNFGDYRSLAFGVHAFDYVEKPIDKQRLHRLMDEFISYQKTQAEVVPYVFETRQGILRIQETDILYFEFLDRNVIMHTKHQTVSINGSLHALGERLSKLFVMPHKSFYVNLAHVRLIKGYSIFLTNGEELPLSQKKSREFRISLNDFLNSCLQVRRKL